LLSIRLTRLGAKKHPFYRIIVTEKEHKRDGRFVEILGYYDPCRTPINLKLDSERVNYWLANGAQPTPTVRHLIKQMPQPATKTDSETTRSVAV
jgi:small subunit ribosomal protein S16